LIAQRKKFVKEVLGGFPAEPLPGWHLVGKALYAPRPQRDVCQPQGSGTHPLQAFPAPA